MKLNLEPRKVAGLTLGVTLAVIVLGALACALAGLLLLGWNVVGVALLAIAVPSTFLTMLKFVGIIYLLVAVINIVRGAVQTYSQKMQFMMAMKMMKNLSDAMERAQKEAEEAAQGGEDEPPDLGRHFRYRPDPRD